MISQKTEEERVEAALPSVEHEETRTEVRKEPESNMPLSHRESEKEAGSKRGEGKQHAETMDLNKSSSRHKESINLPSITTHSNYGDKIFDKQSASTLQKTILVYSMPKANRFNSDPKYSGEPSYCVDSCFKPNPTKGAGFGFGRKKQFPDWMERNMKENPPPGAYFDIGSEGRTKGPTFGISHKYYEKVLIPKEKHSTLQAVRKLSPMRGLTK